MTTENPDERYISKLAKYANIDLLESIGIFVIGRDVETTEPPEVGEAINQEKAAQRLRLIDELGKLAK